MEHLKQYADVNDKDGKVNDNLSSENEEDKNFIDDSKLIETQPSDYLNFKNFERSISSDEEEAFFQSDVDDFLDSDVEASNYLCQGIESDSELEVDDFDKLKKRILKLR